MSACLIAQREQKGSHPEQYSLNSILGRHVPAAQYPYLMPRQRKQLSHRASIAGGVPVLINSLYTWK